MPVQKATTDELLAAYVELRSPTRVAHRFGMSARAVHARLREAGIPPADAARSHSGDRNTPTIAARLHQQAEGRRHVEIDNGYVVVFSDAHYWPGMVSTAHRALLKVIRDIKPTVVVANGDLFDGASVSRHPRINWDHNPTVVEELKAVEERLSEIEDAARIKGHLYWPLGNHDSRFESFLAAAAPQFQGVRGTSLADHFPLWRKCWSLWINGHTVIKHRFKGGIHAARNNTLHAGKTVVTGHLHSLKVTPHTDYNGTRYGVDTGTLAEPFGPQFDYTEDNPVDWRSGFVVLNYRKRELLYPQIAQVKSEGEVEFRGDIITV